MGYVSLNTTALDTKIAALQSQITALQSKQAADEAAIAALQGTLATLQSKQAADEAALTALTVRVAALEGATAPTPPPASTTRVGMQGNIGGGAGAAAQALMLDLGVKIIREDRGDWAIPWAHANNIQVCGIIWLDPNSVGVGADVVELDNEPYYNNWLNGDVHQWAVKARDVAKAVKAAHPTKPVLLPAGSFANNGDTQLPDGTWRDTLLAYNDAAPDIWNSIDGIAIHPYSQPNPPVPGKLSILDKYRADLVNLGHGALPFWVTEVGWPTGGNNWNTGGQTEQQQSDYLAQFIAACRARTDVAVIFPYQLQDWGPRDTDSEHYFGIVRQDGTKKIAYATVKALIS